MAEAAVSAVCMSPAHTFSKPTQPSIRLLAGRGVEGDAHCGDTVQHVSRLRRDADKANLRQVHLIAGELHDELAAAGFAVGAGQLGENITTRGVDLLTLPTGTRLRLGAHAVVELTGLRNPCAQINGFAPGLLNAVLAKDDDGNISRKAGVMAVVLADGEVRPGDPIEVVPAPLPHRPLLPV